MGEIWREKEKRGKKRKKKEKRSSKKCEYCAIWTLFLKFCLAVNDVFFDETPESGPKKFENRRKNFRSGLNIKNVGIAAFFWGVLRPKVRPEAERRDVV